jgi:hypothetical protein
MSTISIISVYKQLLLFNAIILWFNLAKFPSFQTNKHLTRDITQEGKIWTQYLICAPTAPRLGDKNMCLFLSFAPTVPGLCLDFAPTDSAPTVPGLCLLPRLCPDYARPNWYSDFTPTVPRLCQDCASTDYQVTVLTNVNGTYHSLSGYVDPATSSVYQFNIQRLCFTALKPIWAYSMLRNGYEKFVKIISCSPLYYIKI